MLSHYRILLNKQKDRILFVDTETTGVPIDENADYKNIDNWPRIKQIAWIVYKKNGTLESSFKIDITDSDRADISSVDNSHKGTAPIYLALNSFLDSLYNCDVIVGHNIDYDIKVILCELYRFGKDTAKLESIKRFCTMKSSVEICGFDTRQGNRYPKLQELYSKLFHQPFENAHDAYCDIKATADCYWKMFNEGLLDLNDYPFLIDAHKKTPLAKSYVEQAEHSLEKTKSRKITSIYSEACEALGINSLLISAKDGERILNYIRAKYRNTANDYAALAMLLEDDKKAQENAKIRSYDEPLSLFTKAAELGDAYSMFRIGHIYYYDLDDKKSAISWYIKAIEHGYVSADCYYEYANLSSRLYGSQSTDGPKYYNKWAQMCEDGFETITRRHLDLYIEAFEKGRYGQKQNLQKAIDVCQRALAQNRPDFGRTPSRYGLRRTLADLLKYTGNYQGAIEQYELYLQELQDKKEYSFECFMLEEQLLKDLFEGVGIEVNYQKVKQYIEILVNERNNSSIGLYYLGQCYKEGLADYQKDSYKAFQCFEKASNDVPEAMKELGIMYLNGSGCKKNKRMAREYLKKAKSKGLDVSPYLEKASSWLW